MKREVDAHAGERGHGGPFGERSELIFTLACGVLVGVGWALSKANVPASVPTAVFVGAYVVGGWFMLKEVAVALRALRSSLEASGVQIQRAETVPGVIPIGFVAGTFTQGPLC